MKKINSLATIFSLVCLATLAISGETRIHDKTKKTDQTTISIVMNYLGSNTLRPQVMLTAASGDPSEVKILGVISGIPNQGDFDFLKILEQRRTESIALTKTAFSRQWDSKLLNFYDSAGKLIASNVMQNRHKLSCTGIFSENRKLLSVVASFEVDGGRVFKPFGKISYDELPERFLTKAGKRVDLAEFGPDLIEFSKEMLGFSRRGHAKK